MWAIGRIIPVAIAAMLVVSPAALAQPQTKLTGGLSSNTIKAIWCSALFLEESYYWDEGSDEATHYEDMAYELGADLDDVMAEVGLPQAESEEIWAIFDEAAAEFAETDEDGYLGELEICETTYLDKKLKLR
ncbi:hypothetical protein [Pelagibacterium limicola]|uniref:hypothetical protein n=1 Tax=Pelagibacterium limicola TaxID=2791022 RepID=UPI0018AFDD8D|nr:hypothetical protein [Pelagibacterium limicola]